MVHGNSGIVPVKYTIVRTLRLLSALCACLSLTLCARAQETDLGESRESVEAMKAVSPKSVFFVMDVSGSMRGEPMRRMREAVYNILSEGVDPGDRVVLFTFGAGYKKVLDAPVKSEADKKDLFAKVPIAPEAGEGTDIRKPHHEALKLAESGKPRPAFLILLTDSYNDEPKHGGAEWPEYLKYYTPGGRLAVYPKTPENADYERLLREYRRATFGIGIGMDDATARPIERLPKDAPSPAPTPEAIPAPAAPVDPGLPIGPILGGLAALALLGGGLFYALGGKPYPLRVALSSGGAPKDFQLKGSAGVRLGGDGAAAAFDAYPLAGVKEPAAKLTFARGQLTLHPQPNASARVFVNGALLEKPTAVRYGDEIRVALADRELRLKLTDPTKTF